ncbi:NADH dehydrogenase [ubiquinone] 1 subunit C2 [Athalia rosae]|uniref:NADH dehydrogenase [ubiquinone] 1 subunit C2 n=1 Tax=Athalia rosae TaxID=37344 RepID=UPI00203393F9|nr:NADH dehydrogenase [ubiquinone] 1 subunit C2 [Athalia rosae]XP_048505731.1 NADH dehydrogenase [ubiquinone] 1 subunit C2 [Athalia rosae]
MTEKEPDATWALELLSSKDWEEPFTKKWFGPTNGGVLGLASAIYVNYASRRPVWSGLQKHLSYTLIGIGLGYYAQKYVSKVLSEKDAVLRHYVILHPELFPEPERKKWGEVFQEWIPIR